MPNPEPSNKPTAIEIGLIIALITVAILTGLNGITKGDTNSSATAAPVESTK
jgi:Flp pilus assembly pilin Flp